jgi:Flp pilus assembly protein TadB
MMESRLTLAALLSAVFVMLAVRLFFPAPRRLSTRVRPYAIGFRTSLGGSADVRAVSSGGHPSGSALVGVFRPIVDSLARRLDRLIDRQGDRRLASMIRQAGLFPDLPEAERIGAYRIRQLGTVAAWGGIALLLVPVLGLSVAQFLGMEFLLLIVGGTRQRGRLERAIEDRRSRMTIEIYTVNQLLAMRVRAGGGVVSAASAICERGRGDVVSELREAMRMHRAGAGISEAFDRIARSTPEPYCARTYALLAIAEERGVDLADSLLSLSEDVREARRESIKRTATKRRAAMLIPTIAILAPVMLLFVGAPLPRLLLGT